MENEHFIRIFRLAFEAAANEEAAKKMKDYLRGQFEFYGISSPTRKQICKDVYAEYGNPINVVELAKAMFNKPQREFHYVAQELLMKGKKHWELHHIEDFQELITTNSWWDTVDHLASNVIGTYFQKFPEGMRETITQWNASENMWLVRTSIIFQLKYKSDVDSKLLEHCIIPHTQDKEFFIRKAIGWALRQYSRYNPEWVQEFIDRVPMQPLSLKEAKKYI